MVIRGFVPFEYRARKPITDLKRIDTGVNALLELIEITKQGHCQIRLSRKRGLS